MIDLASLDSVKDGTTEQLRESVAADANLLGGGIEVGNMAFMSFPAIVGSFETVARKIDAIAENGNIEGILFSWPHWVSGIRNFGERLFRCSSAVAAGMFRQWADSAAPDGLCHSRPHWAARYKRSRFFNPGRSRPTRLLRYR